MRWPTFTKNASGKFPFWQTGEYGSIYLDKQREPMKQLFAALLDRGFELSSFQLDVISEYIASAKVGMLRLWVNDPSKITLNHLNKMTENIFESSFGPTLQSVFQAMAPNRTRSCFPRSSRTIPG